MKTIKIGKHKVTFYDAIAELPISRFHVYNKMLLVDSGVGSDITDFDAHLERIVAFMQKKDNENAIKEIQNLRQNYYLIQQSLSPKHMAFAALIKEIDGKPRENLTDEALQEIVNMFAEEQKENIDKPLKEAKKKIETELQTYFPALYGDSSEKEYYDLILKRTKLVLKSIVEQKDLQTDIDAVGIELMTYIKPYDFANDNIELAVDRQFEKLCILLTESLHCEPKKYTVLEFYSAFDYLKEKTKKRQTKNS